MIRSKSAAKSFPAKRESGAVRDAQAENAAHAEVAFEACDVAVEEPVPTPLVGAEVEDEMGDDQRAGRFMNDGVLLESRSTVQCDHLVFPSHSVGAVCNGRVENLTTSLKPSGSWNGTSGKVSRPWRARVGVVQHHGLDEPGRLSQSANLCDIRRCKRSHGLHDEPRTCRARWPAVGRAIARPSLEFR
jgi:hypothetical protein